MSSRMIEVFAVVLILLAAVKVIVLSVNAEAWLPAVKALYAKRLLTAIISYALAGLVLSGNKKVLQSHRSLSRPSESPAYSKRGRCRCGFRTV